MSKKFKLILIGLGIALLGVCWHMVNYKLFDLPTATGILHDRYVLVRGVGAKGALSLVTYDDDGSVTKEELPFTSDFAARVSIDTKDVYEKSAVVRKYASNAVVLADGSVVYGVAEHESRAYTIYTYKDGVSEIVRKYTDRSSGENLGDLGGGVAATPYLILSEDDGTIGFFDILTPDDVDPVVRLHTLNLESKEETVKNLELQHDCRPTGTICHMDAAARFVLPEAELQKDMETTVKLDQLHLLGFCLNSAGSFHLGLSLDVCPAYHQQDLVVSKDGVDNVVYSYNKLSLTGNARRSMMKRTASQDGTLAGVSFKDLDGHKPMTSYIYNTTTDEWTLVTDNPSELIIYIR